MKKFLSLLLAAMMLLSCTTAMAEDTITNTTHGNWDFEDADIEAYDSVKYTDDVTVDSNGKTYYDTKGELGTELWMQVTADGQIDVTVPLVLVFQTNIDGGTANTAEKYQILNNNNAEIVVTKIEFDKTTAGDDTTTNKPMTLVSYAANKALQEDEYMVQFTPAAGTIKDKYYVNGTETDASKPLVYATASATTGTPSATQLTAYDAINYAYGRPAYESGLFKLNKTANVTTATPTTIQVDMSTGRLSFVTSLKDKAANNTDDELEQKEFDNTKGIHLMTATYTVAIDTSKQYGYTILGANGTEGTADYGNLTNAGTVVEVTENGSQTLLENAVNGTVSNPNNLNTETGKDAK